MKGFYVVLLVLVAGAVPSYGRTESEGTVFNETQLHESMSNVTVSSRTGVGYTFSYLALQWPESFCTAYNADLDRQCKRPAPPHFTVHGLWPQSGRSRVDCGVINPPYPHLRPNNLLKSKLVPQLNDYWPDLTEVEGYNIRFWEDEYNKHGSCTFNNQIGYFSFTVGLAQRYSNLLTGLTAGTGIVFGQPTSYNVIENAVLTLTQFRPKLKCVPVGNLVFLLEIRFCVGRNKRLRNCGRYGTDCGSSVVIPPPPRRH